MAVGVVGTGEVGSYDGERGRREGERERERERSKQQPWKLAQCTNVGKHQCHIIKIANSREFIY